MAKSISVAVGDRLTMRVGGGTVDVVGSCATVVVAAASVVGGVVDWLAAGLSSPHAEASSAVATRATLSNFRFIKILQVWRTSVGSGGAPPRTALASRVWVSRTERGDRTRRAGHEPPL